MTKALLIDSAAREVREVEYHDSAGLRELVGGWIEVAFAWRSGDVLYVDEEGLFKPHRHFFRLSGRHNDQPLAGNGVVVGREVIDDEGELVETLAPEITPAQLLAALTFLDRAYVDAWAKANASEPAVTITTAHSHEVLTRYGRLFDDMPRPKDDEDDTPKT